MARKKAHVYLIHFEHKYHHAGHYLGFTKHLWFRIITHRANMGAKLLRAVNHAGINWVVVRTWTVESQDLERKLKNLKNSPRLEKVEVLRRSHVRRKNLYYLRGRTGKAARLREKRR